MWKKSMINLYQLKSADVPLDNHYQLLEKIGGGGFSEVWLVKDLRSQVQVALKVYSSVQEMDEEGIKMFRKEFSLVCNLNHTNILKPFTFDIYNGCPYIVLPYCEKGSMAKYAGKLQEEELWDFAGQVAAGLAYMHKHQIIHQDIKPENVLINGDGQLLITDFGISTGVRKTMRRSKNSDDSARDGTIAYMSYECLRDNPVNVMARDIWALGASLYELATGDVPFGDYGGLTQKAKGKIVSLASVNISSGLKDLIKKCLSLDPWDRPSAEDVVNMVASHNTGARKRIGISAKNIALSIIGIAAVVCAFVFFLNLSMPKPGPIVKVNPNDSIFLEQIAKANNVVDIERSKANIASRDVENLCAAAKIYNEAIMMAAVSDSVRKHGIKLWNASQKMIDETYVSLYNLGVVYGGEGATDGAKEYERKSLPLKDYVSPGIESKLMPKKNKKANRPHKVNTKPKEKSPNVSEKSSHNESSFDELTPTSISHDKMRINEKY